MDINEIVEKLIGSIVPCGDSRIDEERMANLREYAFLAYTLIARLTQVAEYKDRHESSMKEMGEFAHREILEIKEMLDIKTPF